MNPQPFIAVSDVEASSRWYQAVLNLKSGHSGADYEQLTFNGQMVMQLHHWDAHHHLYLGNPKSRPYGNGVVLWFQTEEIEKGFKRAQTQRAKILETMKVNSNANHREFWLRDPDGYVVVVAGAYGDIG